MLAPDEILKIVPLARQWRFFYRLLATGLVITDKKVIIYSTQQLGRLQKKEEFLLQDVVDHAVTAGLGGQTFRFRLADGTEITLTSKLSAEDGQMIDRELGKLLAILDNSS